MASTFFCWHRELVVIPDSEEAEMKGHYIRGAQASGKLGHLAPYLKIDEFPQLPKALKGPLRYCKSHSDACSPIRCTPAESENVVCLEGPKQMLSIFHSPNENQW